MANNVTILDDNEDLLTQIHDADLLKEAREALGSFLYRKILEDLVRRQGTRDREREREEAQTLIYLSMKRDQRKRERVRLALEEQPTNPSHLQHLHSVLALCGLPYRNPGNAREFSKEYGKNSLVLIAGRIKNPQSGEMESVGLPYGPKARLLLLHLCSEAVRQRSPEIAVSETLSGFMKALGFAVTGGERGTIRQFKEQLARLAACSMQIGLWDGGDRATTLNCPPFKQLDLWRHHGGESVPWVKTIAFHQDFYENLLCHALPVDIRAARAFSGSARKLDLLFWLGYRLRLLKHPLRLPWPKLYTQFGCENDNLRSFKQAFKRDVSHVCEVFQRLKLVLDHSGLTLWPADRDDLLVPPKRIKRVGNRE